MEIADLAALLGMIFGTAGLVVSILTYLRDKPKIKIYLSWDMLTNGNPAFPDGTKLGIVKVTNTGRRPVYVSHAALVIPKEKNGSYNKYLLLSDSVRGEKLTEGDPPKVYQINPDGFEEYAQHWDRIYVQIEDSTGKTYTSKKYYELVPSWAKDHEESNPPSLLKTQKRKLRKWRYSLTSFR